MDNISRFQKTTGVGQILDESFARCPEREAIVFGDWRITYRELQALIYRQRSKMPETVWVRQG